MALPLCPHCREVDWRAYGLTSSRPHVCAPLYYVCEADGLGDVPTADDVRDSGRRVYAEDAEAAAERHVELAEAEDYDFSCDEHKLLVVAAGSDDVERWTVEARTERAYSARLATS